MSGAPAQAFKRVGVPAVKLLLIPGLTEAFFDGGLGVAFFDMPVRTPPLMLQSHWFKLSLHDIQHHCTSSIAAGAVCCWPLLWRIGMLHQSQYHKGLGCPQYWRLAKAVAPCHATCCRCCSPLPWASS